VERGDLTGTILDGRYRVLEPVAEGAMGIVYRAERVKLGRIVAIKVLHEVLPNELSARKRFEIEAMAMAKLEHPHCASVLDVGVHDDRPYVVMDFVSGRSLKEVIASGPQSIPRATEIVRQVLSGLAHAHEHGIIHRDIKPANLVLSQKTGLGDHVKILDFGLARLHDTGQNLTTGIVVGTPAYMAPEQIRGQKLDHRVDLYAGGVLLFELLTGRKPFHSEKDDPIEVCKMHLSDPIPRLDAMLPGADFGELEAVVAKALAKQRDDRYASAEEFAAALDAAVPRRPSHQVVPVPPPASSEGSIQLLSGDVMEIGDVSYPPSHEVRTGDVLSAIPAEPSDAETSQEPAPAPPETSAAAPLATDARARTATPVAGVERAPAAPPGESESAPGTFLGLPVAPPPVFGSRAPSSSSSSSSASAPAAPSPALTSSSSSPSAASSSPTSSSPTSSSSASSSPTTSSSVSSSPASSSASSSPASPLVASPPALSWSTTASSSSPASPLAASPPALSSSSSPALPSASSPSKAPRALAMPRRRTIVIAGASLAAVVIVGLVIHAAGGKAPATGDAGIASGSASAPESPPDPSREIVVRANDLLVQGDREAALDLLNRSRRQYPASATLAYAAGRIYFSKFFWTDGLKSFRDAIRNDPTYRTDPELIKTVLRGFITTPSYNDELATFLREDIGSAAQPLLEETARDHPNPAIRTRAANELRRYH